MSSAVTFALGAVAAALALDLVPAAAIVIAGAALVLARLALRTRLPRVHWLALALGVAAIGLRGLMLAGGAGPPATLPSGDGPWTATVVSVGSEHGSNRPAVLQLDDPAVLVAATLPWYPVV